IERKVGVFPAELRPTLAAAITRLVDYQDRRYAERYLERLRPFAADPELARVVARHLAVWMAYEDAIRVGQIKPRAGRFERIRREKGALRGEIVVTDFLKPDLDEIYGILPHRLVAPFARWAERRWPHGRPALGQHVKTTTVLGYLRVWMLTLLRPLRPISHRAHAGAPGTRRGGARGGPGRPRARPPRRLRPRWRARVAHGGVTRRPALSGTAGAGSGRGGAGCRPPAGGRRRTRTRRGPRGSRATSR